MLALEKLAANAEVSPVTTPADRPTVELTWRWEVCISGVLLLLACNFAFNFARDGIYFLSLPKYVRLHEALPFQYRILMVFVLKTLMPVVSAWNISRMFSHAPPYLLSPEALAYLTINSISCFIALQTFLRIALAIFSSRGLAACAISLFIMMIYATFILNPVHPFILPYDLPSLAFTQLGTLCIIRQRWKTLLIVFMIATLNRETTFLLIFFLMMVWWFQLRKERNSALIMAIVVSVIWVMIKLILYLTISGDGTSAVFLGGISAWRIADNFAELFKPWQWPSLFINLIPFGILSALLTRRLRNSREWHLTAVVGYAALFPVGLVTEFRAFADLIGFFAISLTAILQETKFIADGEVGLRTQQAHLIH